MKDADGGGDTERYGDKPKDLLADKEYTKFAENV